MKIKNGVANPQEGSSQGSENIYSKLSPELRERMIRVADSMLEIGNNDSWRGQTLTSWWKDALRLYRLLNLNEKTIRERVSKRLEYFLQTGRNCGLSSLPNTQFLDGDVPETTIANIDFQTKYNLNHFRAIRELLGRYEDVKGYYKISLSDAFDLAVEIDDEKKAKEIFFHMLRLGAFEEAYKSAEKIGDERTLINIGNLALVDFFDYSSINSLLDVIESLKRVQGEYKPIAEEMLYDLAIMISSESFMQRYMGEEDDTASIRDRLLNYSLLALRSTGSLIKKQQIDSCRVDFITEVKNRKYAAAIINLVEKVMRIADRPDLDEVRKSLQAVGDTERLNIYAEKLFEKRFHHPIFYYLNSIEFFRAAGNNDAVRRVIDTALTENLESNYCAFLSQITPIMAEIGYTEGLENAKTLVLNAIKGCEEKGMSLYLLDTLKKIENALTGQVEKDEIETLSPKELSDHNYAKAEEEKYRQLIKEYRAELTPEKREELIRSGYKLLEQGKPWDASLCFMKALYREGTIEAADMMLEQGNGLNAGSRYMFASLLPEE